MTTARKMRIKNDYKFLAVQQHEVISKLLAGQDVSQDELKAAYETGQGVFADKDMTHLMKLSESFEYSHETEAKTDMPRLLYPQGF